MIDWCSAASDVLLNPRINSEKRQRYRQWIAQLEGYEAHIWLTTSGTTGAIKFVALSKQAVLHSAGAVNTFLHSTSEDVWLHALPDFHVGGIGIWARGYLSGARVVDYKRMHPKWSPVAFAKLAASHSATLTALVPTQVYDLVSLKLAAPSSLRATIVGGGAISDALLAEGNSLGWNLRPSYGLTECSSQVATADGEGKSLHLLPHIEARVDSCGTICLHSHSLLSCYGYPEESGLRICDPKKGGWLKTEDKGELFGAQLKVYGRSKDFVKVNGESVNLCSLYQLLKELKFKFGIAQELLLITKPCERSGSKIVLAIEGSAGQDVERLVERFNLKVLPFERISGTEQNACIARTGTGKITFIQEAENA